MSDVFVAVLAAVRLLTLFANLFFSWRQYRISSILMLKSRVRSGHLTMSSPGVYSCHSTTFSVLAPHSICLMIWSPAYSALGPGSLCRPPFLLDIYSPSPQSSCALWNTVSTSAKLLSMKAFSCFLSESSDSGRCGKYGTINKNDTLNINLSAFCQRKLLLLGKILLAAGKYVFCVPLCIFTVRISIV